MNIQNWKNQLIEKLFPTKNIAVLKEVETVLKKTDSLKSRICKPMRKAVTAKELAKEKNYQPIIAEAFFKEVDEIDLNENIDELLEMLD